MLGIGILLAGLFMLVVQGAGILKSLRTGLIISRSYGAPRIERASEAARIDKLIRQRTAALGPAVILLIVGFLLTFGGLFVPGQ